MEKGSTITLDVWGEPPSDEGDEGDEGDEDKPKPEKTKAPKPEKPDGEAGEAGGVRGDRAAPRTDGGDTAAPAAAERQRLRRPTRRETSTPAAGGRVTTPGTGREGRLSLR